MTAVDKKRTEINTITQHKLLSFPPPRPCFRETAPCVRQKRAIGHPLRLAPLAKRDPTPSPSGPWSRSWRGILTPSPARPGHSSIENTKPCSNHSKDPWRRCQPAPRDFFTIVTAIARRRSNKTQGYLSSKRANQATTTRTPRTHRRARAERGKNNRTPASR